MSTTRKLTSGDFHSGAVEKIEVRWTEGMTLKYQFTENPESKNSYDCWKTGGSMAVQLVASLLWSHAEMHLDKGYAVFTLIWGDRKIWAYIKPDLLVCPKYQGGAFW